MKKWYIVGGTIMAACLIWFVNTVFFIQEGDVFLVSESPTGEYKVFISEKESLLSSQPKYVAAYVHTGVDTSKSGREIFYYSPDAIASEASIQWKNHDTIVIAGHVLKLPLARHHYLIR